MGGGRNMGGGMGGGGGGMGQNFASDNMVSNKYQKDAYYIVVWQYKIDAMKLV